MPRVNLEVPENLHRKVRWLQIDREAKNKKISLKDLYCEVIHKGLEAMGKLSDQEKNTS